MKEVFEVGLDIIKKIQETQSEKLEQTGHLVAKAFMDGHKFFVSGSGHSHTMAEEMYISELSRMSNSFIAQCINVACAKYLIEHNVEVPVFSSLNCDGTEERNDKLFKKYTRMY